MNLRAALSLFGYGTSDGVEKSWDTRGRGQKQPYTAPKATEKQARSYDVEHADLEKVAKMLTDNGFKWTGSSSSLNTPGSGLTYEPFARTEWQHPDGHTAILEARMSATKSGHDYQPVGTKARLHVTAPKEIHDKLASTMTPVQVWMDSAAGGQTDSSSFIGRKYTVVDTKYGHYISEHDTPDAAEKSARARPYSKVISQPRLENSPVVRDMARRRLVKTNPDVDG